MSAFWSTGFWAEGLWSPGFWGEEQPAVPAAVSSGGSALDDDQIHRDHWDYLEQLERRQVEIQVADDVSGVRTYRVPADMPIPDDLACRAMRGTVRPGYRPTVADALHDPAILAALVLLIDEAEDE